MNENILILFLYLLAIENLDDVTITSMDQARQDDFPIKEHNVFVGYFNPNFDI